MKPIAVDEFCKFKFLSEIEYSPEGKAAAFVVTEIDKKEDEYRSCIHILKDKKIRKLTSFGKERSFQFLDEDTLLFPGKRESSKDKNKDKDKVEIESKYYRISLSGGEAELAYTFPIPVSKVIPLPDGNLILEGTVMPGFEDLYKAETKYVNAYKKYVKDNKDYEIIEQNPWWFNGGSYTKGAYTGLFLWDSKKKKLTWLTKKNQNIRSTKLSKDKKSLYFISTEVKPKLDLMGGNSLCQMNINTHRQTVLAKDTDSFFMEWFELMDIGILVLASDGSYGLNTDIDFYIIDYKTKELSLYARYGESIGTSVGADVRYGGGKELRVIGDTVYFVSTRYDAANIYKLENGIISPVTQIPGSVDCFDIHDDNILAICLHNIMPQELFSIKVPADGKVASNVKQLSKFNTAVLRDNYIAEPLELNVKRQGYEVHGFVMEPINYNPRKKYPVILDIHGGPKTVYGQVFYHEMQYWASKGYFVIFCNPTGSDGRGAFMDIRGQYGGIDYEDIMAFLDAALKAYPAMDKNNLFETGGSYGGFMTNWIIGHTDRFRAVASQRSISNWFSMYGVSDIGIDFTLDQNLSDPWNNPEKLWSHSPMKYANKAKTPTLFIHSFEDYRCPIDQGYQMFSALVAHGVETRLVCFRGENHELSRSGKPTHRLKRLNEITNWFETHKKR